MQTVSMQMCHSIDGPTVGSWGGYTQHGLFSERDWPTCTCKAYKFSKATVNFGGRMVKPECKHILRAQEAACGWHQQWSPETQTSEQEREYICPKCGGSTVAVSVTV